MAKTDEGASRKEIVEYKYDFDVMSLEWWQKNAMYHIYLPSFKDSNNDGMGDFQGLMSKLSYLEDLPVKTLLISPFYPSPMKDNGYDISSYIGINPIYGTMEDFNELMLTVKAKEMNVIIDFVPNHTSDQHPWFQKSVKKEEPYTDFYTWADEKPGSTSKNHIAPNNWLSVFGGSAWTWNEHRKQFYLHQFLPEQPEINLRNPIVIEEMKKVMSFWLDKGVDGFRIDAASHLLEDEQLRDEPLSEETTCKEDEHGYLEHPYTKGHKENLQLLKKLRSVLDEYTERTGKPKIMIAEVFEEISDVMRYYGHVGDKVADFPYNFQLYKLKASASGIDLFEKINSWLKNLPKGKYPNWVLSSHDDHRVATRVGHRLASSLQMVTMLMPGVPICYYGDELGMKNTKIRDEEIRDSFALRTSPKNSRDPMRTPMQWNCDKNAGFSDSDKTWLPVSEDFKTINVEVEKKDPTSFLNMFIQLLKLREEPTILVGLLVFPKINETVFSFFRFLEDSKCYLLVLNMSSKCVCVNLSNTSEFLPNEAFLELSNGHLPVSYDIFPELKNEICKCSLVDSEQNTSSARSDNRIKVSLDQIHLKAKEAKVLSFIGQRKK